MALPMEEDRLLQFISNPHTEANKKEVLLPHERALGSRRRAEPPRSALRRRVPCGRGAAQARTPSPPRRVPSRRATARGIECPPPPEVRAYLHAWKARVYTADPDNKIEKGKNWGVFDFCNQVLQTAEELREATRLVVQDRAASNVVHCEVRFCPELHTLEGLSDEEAVEAACLGMQDAIDQSSFPLTGGVIICALRSFSEEHSMRMAALSHRFLWKGVVGFDIAGDEGSYPLHLHRRAIEHAKANGVPVTVHAGEWIRGTLPNIQLALDLGVNRLGHGMAMAQCPDTLAAAAAAGVTVECCLSGNIKPWMEGAPRSYEEHPIRAMRAAGVRCALSSDNVMLSGTAERQAESTNELARLVHSVGFSWPEAREVMLAGAEAAFLPDGKKQAFLSSYAQRLEEAWENCQYLQDS